MKFSKKIAVYLGIVLALITCVSLSYCLFATKFGVINYSVEPGLKFSGKKKQYGKENSEASDVSCELMPGYVFNGWDDGNNSLERRDLFKQGTSNYIAQTDYKTYESLILSYDSSKKTAKVINNNSIKNLSFERFEKAKSFYNLKGLSKFDYYCEVSNNNAIFENFQNSYFYLKSMNVDKTFSRQLLAFELSKILFSDFDYDFNFVNLYIDDKYSGLYMAFDFAIPKDSCIIIEENMAQSNSVSFLRNKRYNYVLRNDLMWSSEKIEKEVINSIEQKKIDYESLQKAYALTQFLKNNAFSEDDFCYYLDSDSVIHYLPLSSFSLSAGLWKWLDYGAQGNADYNSLLSLLTPDYTDKTSFYINNLFEAFDSVYSNVKNIINQYAESIKLNYEIWSINSAFGTPVELENSKTINQHISYMDEFLEKRVKWLKNMYLK